jgi:hypothetical protein
MSDTLTEEQTTAPMHWSTMLSHHTCTHKRAPKSHATTTLSQLLKRREALEHALRQRRQLIVVETPAEALAGSDWCLAYVYMSACMYVYVHVCIHACVDSNVIKEKSYSFVRWISIITHPGVYMYMYTDVLETVNMN